MHEASSLCWKSYRFQQARLLLKIQCMSSTAYRICKDRSINLKTKGICSLCQNQKWGFGTGFDMGSMQRMITAAPWLLPAGRRFCQVLFHFWRNRIWKGHSYCSQVTSVLHFWSLPPVTSQFLLPQHVLSSLFSCLWSNHMFFGHCQCWPSFSCCRSCMSQLFGCDKITEN